MAVPSTLVMEALWVARGFIREAVHQDNDYHRQVAETVDAALAECDPVYFAEVIAAEATPAPLDLSRDYGIADTRNAEDHKPG